MNAVTLRPNLIHQLETEAERRQTDVEALVNDWLEEFLWEQKHQKIKEESARYRAMHTQLRQKYADKVIALRDGEVVDSGEEIEEVYYRTRAKYGDEAILITRVGPEPVETFTIRSPRLASAGAS